MNLPTVPGDYSSLGGLASYLRNLATSIAAGWNVEHQPDGTHQFTWIDVPYSAGYYSSNAGSWTVAAADQATLAYVLLGTTMVFSFTIGTSTVAGGPNYLHIQIPGGYVARRAVTNGILAADNGVFTSAAVQTVARDSKLWILRSNAAAWANATDTTAVVGQITFEVE